MTPAKDKFRPGEAYVAFSRVKTPQKLHIIHYTRSQIRVSEHVEKEMKRLRKNILPQMPSYLFHDCSRRCQITTYKYGKFQQENERYEKWSHVQDADIISLNKTHLGHSDLLTLDMMGINKRYVDSLLWPQ